MSPEQAKQLDMQEVLLRLGHIPVSTKKGGKEYWYRSPFRKEKTPSFHITFKSGKQIWVWNDFGDGVGGNLLDFLMLYRKESLGDVLKFLRSNFSEYTNDNRQRSFFPTQSKGNLTHSFAQSNEQETPILELVKAVPIQHSAIVQYLEEIRKIPRAIFQYYLLEIHYWNKEKDRGFFAFGMQNESQGYEIRSASDQYIFKSVLNQRDISHIEGRVGDLQTVNVFEGMLDYLSLLVLLNTNRLNGDAIILHSISSYQQCKTFIEENGYQLINTFLDNDATGTKCTDKFKKDFAKKVYNQSLHFANYKDLNDALQNHSQFLKAKNSQTIFPIRREVEP